MIALAPNHSADARRSALSNEDLAPVPIAQRPWRMWDFVALWVSMAACIPTYMLASSLIGGGMNWWQAILTIFLGNLIVLIPMVLNAHAGTRYGIPFPVYCRAAFGIVGANVPAILRALGLAGLLNLPGFLVHVKWMPRESVPALLVSSYDYAWFIGFAVAFLAYLVLRKLSLK